MDRILVLRHRDTDRFLALAGLTSCPDDALGFGDVREARGFARALCEPAAFDIVDHPGEQAA